MGIRSARRFAPVVAHTPKQLTLIPLDALINVVRLFGRMMQIAPRKFVLVCGVGLTAACAPKLEPVPPVQVQSDIVAVLYISNVTPQEVGIYFVDDKSHSRIGLVAPQSESSIPIRNTLLRGRSVFRIYAFRGKEPCPVARIIDISASKTPRVTVAMSDTVVSGYFSTDACITAGKGGQFQR